MITKLLKGKEKGIIGIANKLLVPEKKESLIKQLIRDPDTFYFEGWVDKGVINIKIRKNENKENN